MTHSNTPVGTGTLVERDARHIWHPYTQMKIAAPPLPIVAARGAELIDEQGNTYIDTVSSWWVNLHGHAHPYIAERVHRQLMQLEHVIFAGFTHPPAVELAERLLAHLPEGQNRVFYSDNGSTAVEIGIKMAIQYFFNRGEKRRRLIAFEQAFHGETFGSMSASGDLSFNTAFESHLFEVLRIPVPVPGRQSEALWALEQHLKSGEAYAFIFEPLVLGAGGMIMYEPEVLSEMIAMCHRYGVLCIADEVMTGFGRTGRIFASNHLSEAPDIVCMSKGLTGGTLPLAVTSCTEAIFQAFYSEDKSKTFFHGHSYTANPVGCAAALASLDLLEKPESAADRERIAEQHRQFRQRIEQHPAVRATRQRGTILAVEFESEEATGYFNSLRDRLYAFFLERGLLMRPLGNLIYMIPPYCITNEQLQLAYDAMDAAFTHFLLPQKEEPA